MQSKARVKRHCKMERRERPRLRYKYLAPPNDDFAPEDGKSKPNVAYGYVAQAVQSKSYRNGTGAHRRVTSVRRRRQAIIQPDPRTG